MIWQGKLTSKLLVITIVLSLIPLLIITTLFSRYFYQSYALQALSASTALLGSTEDAIDEKISQLFMASTLAVTDKTVRTLMNNDARYQSDGAGGMSDTNRYVIVREFFYSLEILYPDICGSTLITNRNAIGNYTGGQLPDPEFFHLHRGQAWFWKSYELAGSPNLITKHNPYQTKGSHLEVISVSRSIFDAISHQYLGTILIDSDIYHLEVALRNAKMGKGDFMFLLDQSGNVIVSGGDVSPLHKKIQEERPVQKEEGLTRLQDAEGKWYYFNYITSDVTGWILGQIIPESAVLDESVSAAILIAQGMAAIIILMLAGALYTIQTASRPIVHLAARIDRIGKGDLSDYYNEYGKRRDEVGQLSRSIYKMKDSLRELIEKLAKANDGQKEAQLKALQSQINPHFILNTLTSIQMLEKLGRTDDAAAMLEDLGHMFKTYIRADRTLVTVQEETKTIASYIRLQKMRHGEKLRYTQQVPEELLSYSCLKFVVQPLVENAILHGVEKRKEPTDIILEGQYIDERHIRLTVLDNGPGIPEANLLELREKLEDSSHTAIDTAGSIGMLNVHNRLQLYYGDEYGIRIESEEGKGTKVDLILPLIEEEDNPLLP